MSNYKIYKQFPQLYTIYTYDTQFLNSVYAYIESIIDIIDFKALSNVDFVNLQFIESHIDKPWDFYVLSDNPYLTTDFVDKYITKGWNMYSLKSHPNIPKDFLD
jgi:hypothetical protein